MKQTDMQTYKDLLYTLCKPEKNVSTKKYNNCFICFARSTLYFGTMGVTLLRFNCPHSKIPSKTYIERSNTACFLAICASTLLLLTIANNVFDKTVDLRQISLVHAEMVIHLAGATLYALAVYQQNTKVNELYGLNLMVELCAKNGMITLDDKLVKRYTTIFMFFIISCVITLIMTVTTLFIDKCYPLNCFKGVLEDLSFFIEFIVGAHYTFLGITYLRLFSTVLEAVRETLQERFKNRNLQENLLPIEDTSCTIDRKIINQYISKRLDVTRKINNCQRLYLGLHKNLSVTNSFMNPSFLIWWNAVVAATVTCVYLIIKHVKNGMVINVVDGYFMYKVICSLLAMVSYFVVMATIADVVSEIF